MTYASVNGLRLYYEVHGELSSGGERPLVLLHGGLMTIELNWGQLLAPLAVGRPVIAVELQEHGHTGACDRPMTMDALAGDIIGLLDHLGVAQADLFGFSLGAFTAYAVAFAAPDRVGKLVVVSADPQRPPGRESAPISEDRLPTQDDFLSWQAAYAATAPDPAQFDKSAAKTAALVHEMPGWTADQLRGLRVPALLIFGDRDFSPLADVVDTFALLPDARLAVLPDTTHMGVTQHPYLLLSLVTPFLGR